MQDQSQDDQMHLTDRLLRNCPVCGNSPAHARAFLSERIDPARLNAFSFSSRKEPEFLNYRMVQCPGCDVVYVDQPPSQVALAQAYHAADYDSAEEADDAAAAYLRELEPILARLNKGTALEIGTGTGALLDGLAAKGFDYMVGIEPSSAAIASAPAYRRSWIREGIFRESDYQPESFDLICCFMTLEHVREPREIAESVWRLLKPGGAFVTVTHDYRSLVNRMLGRRSPIIDLEHMQLFSRGSISALFQRAGYSNIEVKPFTNRYAVSYWIRLMPMSPRMKQRILRRLGRLGLDRRKLSLNVGNMITFGIRPKTSVRPSA